MPLDDTNWIAPDPEIVDETTALLIRARGFLERGWCRGALARAADGNPVGPLSEKAVMWCPAGALIAAQGTPGGNEVAAIQRLAIAVGGKGFVAAFNDAQETVEPILAAFDRAIGR